MKKGERRVMAVLGPVVIYCYTAPVHSCIDNESYHSMTESDESARNATYINNEERLRGVNADLAGRVLLQVGKVAVQVSEFKTQPRSLLHCTRLSMSH